MGYESIIRRAMAGDTDPDEAVQQAALLYAVQRAITCPISGRVLDVRRAVLVELPAGGTVVCDAETADERLEGALADIGIDRDRVTITDGRKLTW
jgi:hypothetical protein